MKSARLVILIATLCVALYFLSQSEAIVDTLDYRNIGGFPRGLRDNNPGMLRPLSSGSWNGQVGVDDGPHGPYVIFESVLAGERAASINLLTYVYKHKLTTPLAIAERWSPSSDNNTPSNKAKLIAKALGIGINDDLASVVLEKGPKIMSAITVDENTLNPIPEALYIKAWALAREYKNV